MRHVRNTRHRPAVRPLLLAVCLAVACGAAVLPSSPAVVLQPSASAATAPAAAVSQWVRSGPRAGVVNAIAASKNGPPVVYAYLRANGRDANDRSRHGLFKSTDSGATWVKTSFPSALVLNTVLSIAVDPTNSAVVYAGTFRNGVFKSTDSGATWSGPFLPPDREVVALAVDPLATNNVYASLAGFGVFKSTDGGVTWASTHTGITNFGMLSLAVDHTNSSVVYAAGASAGPGQFGGVFKSTNGGANWTRQVNGLPFISDVYELAIDPTNSSTIHLATSGGVFKSTDGAASWGPPGAGLPPGARVMNVAVSPADSSTVVASGFDFRGIYRSTDGGANWQPTSGADGAAFNDLAFDAGANLYGGSIGAGIYRSTDGGATSAPSSEGLPFALTTHVTPDPNNYAAVYVGGVDGIHSSPDGGARWDAAGFNLFSPQAVRGIAFDPNSPLTLYAGIDLTGVWKTTDGGRTWANIFGVFNRNVNLLVIDPSNPRTLYFANSFARLQKTTDGGATWTQLGFVNNYRALAVDPSNSSVLYAVTDFGPLLKSTNGGTTFTPLTLPSTGLALGLGVTVDPASPSTVYVYGSGSANPVQKSIDGGATWNPASNGLPPTSDGAHSVSSLVTDPVNTSILYAACNGPASAGGGVYRSTDGGANWSLYETALDFVRAVALSPSGRTVYAATEQGVYTSQAPPALFTFSADALPTSEGAGAATVTVNRADATTAATVNFATADGSARAGQDYEATSGTLTFAPGETTKTFTVSVINNTADEFDEGVVLTLSATGGTPSVLARASLVIVDDDPLASVSVGDVSAPEGDFDNQTFVFPVTLSAPSEKVITVNLSLASGTAGVGGDTFQLDFGASSLTFAPGETLKTLSVLVRPDLTIEPDETFFVNLSNIVNAAPGDSQGQGTILNDDAVPTISVSINDATVVEGNYGTTDAAFTLTLSAPTNKTVKVDYQRDFGANGTVTFAPGETTKTFTVPVTGNIRFFRDSQGEVRLTNPRNVLLGDGVGALTILNDDAPPVLTVGDLTVREGDSGSREIFFPVTLSAQIESQVAFTFELVPGTATAGEDYVFTSGRLLFSPEGTVTGVGVTLKGDALAEGDETFFLKISDPINGVTIADDEGKCVIINDDGPVAPSFRWSASDYKVSEGARQAFVQVVRAGDLSIPAEVQYEAGVGTASDRSDYTTAIGTLRFAAGEASKSFPVLITDDGFAETAPPSLGESLSIALLNPSPGVVLAEPRTTTVTIIENDLFTGTANHIDATDFFVRQQYHDFLNREPDSAGLAFWSNGILQCGDDAQCREVRRINTSAAFFLSIEFQRTGYQVIRVFRASFPATPQRPQGLPRYREFLGHSQEIGRGVVVGVGNWEQQLRDQTLAFARRWVDGAEFVAQFPATMTAAEFVDQLFANTGATPTDAERNAALAAFAAGGTEGRAAALLSVSDSGSVNDQLKSPAFVLMQYFGYLRRNPDDPQDTNFDGYFFWLTKLNQFGGNYEQAEMVKAFIQSIEYRRRFGD